MIPWYRRFDGFFSTGNLVVLAMAILVSFLLYGNSIPGQFVYDDRAFVDVEEFKEPGGLWLTLSDPSFITKVTAHRGIRPLSSFTFALNFFLFGESPVSFHIVNIVLHALASFLVFIVVDLLFKNKMLSLFSAALFLWLPIHTEAVAFIKARDEILLAIFVLLAWVAFIKATYRPNIHWPWLGGSALLFFLALLSKEFALTAPFLFLFVYYIRHRAPLKNIVVIFSAFLPIYFLYWLLARDFIFQGAAGSGNSFTINPLLGDSYLVRFWTAFKIAWLYIAKIIFPVNLSASYDYNQLTLVANPLESWQALLGIMLLALFVISMVYKKIAATPIGIGAATFFIPYFIFSKFIVVGGQIMGERWVYFASAGICLMMAFVLEKFYRRNKKLALVCLVLVLGMYSAVIIQRNPVWRNELALFESMVETAPNSIQGHKALALAYLKAGDYERAIPHVEASMRIYIDYEPIILMLRTLSSYYSDEEKSGKKVVVRGIGEVNNRLLALAQARDGKHVESLKTLENLVAIKPERQENPIVLFTYALNYHALGNTTALENYLEWVPGSTREGKFKNLESF